MWQQNRHLPKVALFERRQNYQISDIFLNEEKKYRATKIWFDRENWRAKNKVHRL